MKVSSCCVESYVVNVAAVLFTTMTADDGGGMRSVSKRRSMRSISNGQRMRIYFDQKMQRFLKVLQM